MPYRASRLGIFGSSHFLTSLTFQVLVRDLPSLITGRLYTKCQNLFIKTKKTICGDSFSKSLGWLTHTEDEKRQISAFKIYHAGPSNNISERRLYHACGFYSVGELQVINLSKILQQIFSNKFSRFYIKYLFQDPDRGWRTYWGILWLHRGCDQFKVKGS